MISDMFGVLPRLTRVQSSWVFLESLGDRYDGHPYAGLVYDAIVKAEEMLCDDTPPSLAIFVDALEHNRDVNNKKALSLSNGCFDEHMRLQDKERLAEQFFRVRGLLNNDQKINFQRYEENRQFSMAVATRTKESVIDLLDEIETSNRVIDCFKRQEIQLLNEVEFFDGWINSPEFQKFAETYDYLQYTMTRIHKNKSTAERSYSHD